MTTIALRHTIGPGYDFVNDNGIQTEEGLETAIIISLFSNRRATEQELRLAGLESDHLGGWWGDSFPEIDGDVLGSKLWLLERGKRQQATLDDAERYADEALVWLVDDKVAETVTPTASFFEDTSLLIIAIEVERPDDLQPKFRRVWEAIAGIPRDLAA